MMIYCLLLAAMGFCISVYALVVERILKQNPTYKPACDISEVISCSKPMKSQYASLFYFSNTLWGIAYYLLVAAFSLLDLHLFLLIVTSAGVFASAILAYILYFKIRAFCIVCTSLYAINLFLFFCAMRG